MNNTKLRYLLILILFIGIFAAAVIGYNALSKAYVPVQPGLTLTAPSPSGETEAVPDVTDHSPDAPADTPAESPSDASSDGEEDEVNAIEAPDFTVLDAAGNPVSLSDRLADGKPIVLNFWATWCGPCKSELPAFDKAAAEYADRITFMFINLTDGYQETTDGVKSFLTENGYTFPVYFDVNYSAALPYGANSIPLTYFLTSTGLVAGGYMGAMSEEALYSYLEQLLALE